jgi:iron(III) transport system permease protein
VAGWDSGFGQQGWLDYAAGQQSVPILAGWRGAIWVHAMAAIPWVTVILAVAFRTMVPEWEESAMLDGSTASVFTSVTLPQLAPAIVVAGIWVLIVTTGEITITDVYQVRTYAEELYVGFARDLIRPDGELVEMQTGPIAGSLLVGWLTLGAMTACAWMWPTDRPVSVRDSRLIALGGTRWLGTAFLLAIVALLILLPVGNLAYKLGILVEQTGEVRVRSWSVAKAADLMLKTPLSYPQEVAWSLALSQVTALVTLALGLPIAWLANRQGFWRMMMFGLAAFCFAIPGPIVAIVLIRGFSQSGVGWLNFLYDRTIAAPAMVMVVRSLPFLLLILWQAFRTVPRADLENARMAGASSLQQLFQIAIPQRYSAIGCAWFVAVALSMGELTSSILVVPPGVTTLSIRIFGLVHYGVEDRLAAVCLWTMILFAGLACIVYVLATRWFRRVTYNR